MWQWIKAWLSHPLSQPRRGGCWWVTQLPLNCHCSRLTYFLLYSNMSSCLYPSVSSRQGCQLQDKGSMMRKGWYLCQPPQLDLLLHGSAHCQNSVIPVFWTATVCKTNLLLYRSYSFTPDWGFVKVLSHREAPRRLSDLGCGCSPSSRCLYEQECSLHWTPLLSRKQRIKWGI